MTSKFYYRVISEACGDPDLKDRLTYGLLVEAVAPGKWEHVQILHDVSPDLELAMHIADLFNTHQLHPIHLLDVVEDMLP